MAVVTGTEARTLGLPFGRALTRADLENLPYAVGMADDTELQPDVLVARAEDLAYRGTQSPPLLVVEVLSPSTRRFDLTTKRDRYEEFGAGSYWVVDPLRPSLIAWDLVDGHFVEVAHVEGDQEYAAERPFPVTIRPSALRD